MRSGPPLKEWQASAFERPSWLEATQRSGMGRLLTIGVLHLLRCCGQVLSAAHAPDTKGGAFLYALHIKFKHQISRTAIHTVLLLAIPISREPKRR